MQSCFSILEATALALRSIDRSIDPLEFPFFVHSSKTHTRSGQSKKNKQTQAPHCQCRRLRPGAPVPCASVSSWSPPLLYSLIITLKRSRFLVKPPPKAPAPTPPQGVESHVLIADRIHRSHSLCIVVTRSFKILCARKCFDLIGSI